MSDDLYAGPWVLSGLPGTRKLRRLGAFGEVAEWLFEMDEQDTVFKDRLAGIKREYGNFSADKAEPAREKTTTEVKEVHLVRREGAPLDGPTNVVYGPIDTANDAIIIAHLINEKFDLDEGEVYEAVTRKTTVEVTIL